MFDNTSPLVLSFLLVNKIYAKATSFEVVGVHKILNFGTKVFLSGLLKCQFGVTPKETNT